MHIVFAFGRLLFVAYFIFAGLQKLMNVAETAAFFAGKFEIPAPLVETAASFEHAVGLSTMQLLVLLAGAIELAAALLIAVNVGTRAMAIVLIVFTAAGIFYVDDFWNMSGEGRGISLVQAMLRASLIGGLVLLVALGPVIPRFAQPKRPGNV